MSKRKLGVLLPFAEDQWGLVTRAQAADHGVSGLALGRLVDAGVMERVIQGIYRVRGGAEHPLPSLYAAWLALEPGTPAWKRDASSGAVSHQSAAR